MRWLLPLLSIGVLAACGFSADAAGGIDGQGGFDTGSGAGPNSGGFVPTDPPTTADAMGPETSEASLSLLAGEWDDSLNFAPWYTDFRDQYLSYRDDPNVDVTGRIVVHVESEQGAPIPNARVSLPGEGPNGLVSLGLTTTRGQVQYFPLHDPADPAEAGSLFTVQIAGQPTQDIAAELVDDDELKLVVPAFDPALPTQLDIALVLDTTLSLEDEVQYLKSTLGQLDTDVGNAFPESERRYALVAYRDVGDMEYVARIISDFDEFTDLTTFVQGPLNEVGVTGGGDYPEAVDAGLQETLNLAWEPDKGVRMAFIVGDAPAHEDKLETLNGLTEQARQAGIRLYPVGASGTGDRAQFFFRQAALMTLGRYLFLTTDTELADLQAAEDSGMAFGTMPCYLVQDLRRVMFRMIASELTGMREPAQEGDVVGTIGSPDLDGLCTFNNGATAQTSAQLP